MQAELIFKMPEESMEFQMASWGHRYWSALAEINHALRNHTKYGVSEADTLALIRATMDDVSILMEELR